MSFAKLGVNNYQYLDLEIANIFYYWLSVKANTISAKRELSRVIFLSKMFCTNKLSGLSN